MARRKIALAAAKVQVFTFSDDRQLTETAARPEKRKREVERGTFCEACDRMMRAPYSGVSSVTSDSAGAVERSSLRRMRA
jgi:hypothetical protein